jgi:hypothetical protein
MRGVDLAVSDAWLDTFRDQQAAKARARFALPSLAELEALATNDRLVYFVECQQLIKVGSATDVRDRVSCLQVGCPYELTLLGTIRGGHRAESALHGALNGFRFRGEWFSAPVVVRRAIRGLLGIDEQGRKL